MCNNGMRMTMMSIAKEFQKKTARKKKEEEQRAVKQKNIYPAGEFKPDIDQS
jgi:hypothetical protein